MRTNEAPEGIYISAHRLIGKFEDHLNTATKKEGGAVQNQQNTKSRTPRGAEMKKVDNTKGA